MAFEVIFSVQDGCGDHKNTHFKAFPRNFSVILTNSSFVSFLAYDLTLRHSYPVTILFSGRCNVFFGKSITCSLLKTQQVRNTFKGLWEINKRVKIWCNVRSYPGCPKLPRLTVTKNRPTSHVQNGDKYNTFMKNWQRILSRIFGGIWSISLW